MSEVDESYTAKVGMEQGATKLYVKQDGSLKFFDRDYKGEYLRNVIESQYHLGTVVTSVVLSSLNSRLTSMGAIVGAMSNSLAGGTWLFDMATGNSLFSMSMPLANASGVVLKFRGDLLITDANVLVNMGVGASMSGLLGADISSFNMSAGAYLEVMQSTSTSWAIISRNGSVSERTSA